MILHQGDRYVCNGTQVHPGSLNFLKSSLEIGVRRTSYQVKNSKISYNEIGYLVNSEKWFFYIGKLDIFSKH